MNVHERQIAIGGFRELKGASGRSSNADNLMAQVRDDRFELVGDYRFIFGDENFHGQRPRYIAPTARTYGQGGGSIRVRIPLLKTAAQVFEPPFLACPMFARGPVSVQVNSWALPSA